MRRTRNKQAVKAGLISEGFGRHDRLDRRDRRMCCLSQRVDRVEVRIHIPR